MTLLDGVAFLTAQLGGFRLLATAHPGERGANFLLDVFFADFLFGLVAATSSSDVVRPCTPGLRHVHFLDAHALALSVFARLGCGFLAFHRKLNLAHNRRTRELLHLGANHVGLGGRGRVLLFGRIRFRGWSLFRLGLVLSRFFPLLGCRLLFSLLGLQGIEVHLANHFGALLGHCFRADFSLFGGCRFFLGFGRLRGRFCRGLHGLSTLDHGRSLTLAELAQVNFRLFLLLLGRHALFGARQGDAFAFLDGGRGGLSLFLDFLVALEVGPHQGIRLGVQLGVGLGLDLDAFGRQKLNHGGHAKVELTGDFAQAYRFV